MKKHIFFLFAMILTTIFANNVNAQTETPDLRTKHYNIDNKLAAQGYDVVAYFIQNKAVKGIKTFPASANGLIYHFATDANRSLFLKDYKKYEPQYGGWCAYAMGENNEKVSIDPETFKIIGGKLYLFYNSWGTNTLTKWNKNETTLKGNADKNWLKTFK